MISDFAAVAWPSATIMTATMKSFLEFALRMKSCNISVGGTSGADWLMNMYYTCHGIIYRDTHELCFTLDLLREGHSFVSGAKFKLTISHSNISPSKSL
jgi:hypothetical protein